MKKIIVTFTTCWLLNFTSSAQQIEWENTIGGSNGDKLYSIAPTNDGGSICAGGSWSDISGDKTENTIGSGNDYDYWVIKLDVSGNIQWQNTIGGNNSDIAYSISQTADGGYICGGSSSSDISGDKTENNIGINSGEDFWIIKLDASGSIQWQNTIGGDETDILYSIAQTADGSYICGGYSLSAISGDKTEVAWGQKDYWVIKLDAAGNVQWDKTIGGYSPDYLYSVAQTSDGGFICGGHTYSNISGNITQNTNGLNDLLLVKLDASGNIQWQNSIGGSAFDEMHSLVPTPDGGCVCGGYSNSGISGDKTENSAGYMDYWIVKLDASGNIQWQNTIGGNEDDYLYSISRTDDGGYICAGESVSDISGDKTENCRGGRDYWAVKIDATGNVQWDKTIGSGNSDYLSSVSQTADGDYVCGGYSRWNFSGDKMENSLGEEDYWVAKITDQYNTITGKLFIDFNLNAVQDTVEPVVTNKQVMEINTGRFAFTRQDGSYELIVLDSGNFTSDPAPVSLYTAVPAVHNSYFAGFQQTDSLNDFAFQASVVFNDLCVTITPMGLFRQNMNASYMITYENVGTTTLNGTVVFFPDDYLSYVSSSVTPLSVTPDSIKWDTGTLTPFQSGNIIVTVHVSNGTLGSFLTSTVRIDPIAGDANPVCNNSSWRIEVTGAVDPNIILVDRSTILTTELTNAPYLDYIIHFQNTGNDTAFNVKILNPIDTFKLQPITLEFVSSSHPANIKYNPWKCNMEFKFDNILLPDSNINEPGSHGFIRYRIKPLSTLVVGDSIKNNAAIYFDFNQPVMTNTAVTEIVLPTGEESFGLQVSGLKLYPNPAREKLIVKSALLVGQKAEVKIYDLFGREVFQSSIFNLQSSIKINVSGFSQGIYFIQLQSGEENLRAKFLKR
ncbi:MAG TPA: T9SS type A sorting domain-containing protein [Bacteroidia bacterium]|nr:T9SS type A sorting domain-containing protein [Bacteroidia bacterium]